MTQKNHNSLKSRRNFIQFLAMLGVGGQSLFRSGDLKAAISETRDRITSAQWPEMSYRKLGRTHYNASRLIFGCGAALSNRPNDRLLETAFSAGVNIFDVGMGRYYNNAEKNLAHFAKKHRDDIFLISKAGIELDVAPNESISVEQAKAAAKNWQTIMDESLKDLATDHVDAYYLMGTNNPSLVASDEIYDAFLKAKRAGKVSWLGLSSHQNTEKVLTAAIQSGRYDLAMIAITPGGWYDWAEREILKGSPRMSELQPLLAQAREAGIGLIGMKAGRFLAGRKFLGMGNPKAFNKYYDEEFQNSALNDFQRSYAFVLGHGMDAVNADMQNYLHLKENFVAAATSYQYFNTA